MEKFNSKLLNLADVSQEFYALRENNTFEQIIENIKKNLDGMQNHYSMAFYMARKHGQYENEVEDMFIDVVHLEWLTKDLTCQN